MSNVEYMWLIIFVSKLFLFLLTQKLGDVILQTHLYSCKKFGHRKYCKICECRKTFETSWEFYIYISDFIFTICTVLVILYYVFKILKWFSHVLPVSIFYLLTFGQYDPLLKFNAPPWWVSTMF